MCNRGVPELRFPVAEVLSKKIQFPKNDPNIGNLASFICMCQNESTVSAEPHVGAEDDHQLADPRKLHVDVDGRRRRVYDANQQHLEEGLEWCGRGACNMHTL